MFKSKTFRYCAIAAVVVVTSGAVLFGSATLQSQSQSQSQLIKQLPNSEKLGDRLNNLDKPSGRMLKQLNLSPEQLLKLKAIRDRNSSSMRELVQQSRQANKELRDLLAGTESSEVIRTKHAQVLNLQQELQKQHFERMLAMREILTPQQRSQLNEIMQKNRSTRPRDRMQNRMEKQIENLGDQTIQ